MIRDIASVGTFATSRNMSQVSTYSHFGFDLEGNIELNDSVYGKSMVDSDSVDTLEHLLGDPFDYMYDIVWESNI